MKTRTAITRHQVSVYRQAARHDPVEKNPASGTTAAMAPR